MKTFRVLRHRRAYHSNTPKNCPNRRLPGDFLFSIRRLSLVLYNYSDQLWCGVSYKSSLPLALSSALNQLVIDEVIIRVSLDS